MIVIGADFIYYNGNSFFIWSISYIYEEDVGGKPYVKDNINEEPTL